jgi:Lrp/AsnC family leucine-responsive transcriptional regulator
METGALRLQIFGIRDQARSFGRWSWVQLDAIDRRLLAELTANGRVTTTALAKVVGLSGPAVHERLRKLSEAGVVRGYAALVDPVAVDAGTAAFVSLHMLPGARDHARLEAALAADPSVLEVHETAGEDCYLIKVRVASPQALSAMLQRFKRLGPVASTRTTIVLRTALERPLRVASEAEERQPEEELAGERPAGKRPPPAAEPHRHPAPATH